ncbi:MAG: 50S ribosomal protein L5, partial [Armatimonadetes bacterium]|nr:50S ribosomal protein L5 [Armatimonadota bacterium]
MGKPRLKEKYHAQVRPALQTELGLKNIMQVPRVDKVVINMGVGTVIQDAKTLDAAVRDMTAIAGQKPVVTRARRSIAAFKIREGMRIGCMVTLRGDRMWYFLDKLINAAVPRIRDFGG